MRRPILLVVALALVVRLVYAHLVWTPAFRAPDDEIPRLTLRNAYLVAAGLGYSQVLPGSPALRDIKPIHEAADYEGLRVTAATGLTIAREGLYPETLYPPGMAVVGAAMHRAFGIPIRFGLQALGVVLDAAACGLLCLLVLLTLGQRRVALLSGIVYATFPPVAYNAVSISTLSLAPFFSVLVTAAFVLGAQAPTPMKRYLCYAGCGLAGGVASYFRSDVLLLAPFLAIGLWLCERRLWRAMAIGIGILAISLVLLFPWALRNHRAVGKWVFTSTALGVNLVNGLGEYANPWGIEGTDVARSRDARAHGLPSAFHHEADAFFRERFFQSVEEHPARFAVIMIRRFMEQVIATPYDWGFDLEGKKKESLTKLRAEGRLTGAVYYILTTYWFRLLSAGFMFVCLACSVFMLIRERKHHPFLVFVLLAPAYYALSHIPLHMEPRYLIPGAFGLFLGPAYVVDRLVAGRHQKEYSSTRAPA